MFTTDPSKVHTQWLDNSTKSDPPRAETEQYWKNIWEEASHSTSAQSLVDLRADHNNLPGTGSSNNHNSKHSRERFRHEELDSTRP